jgi:linoleoyl-CoA desaturase
MAIKPKFQATDKSEFSRVLRERVNAYFKENDISTYANTSMAIRTILLIVGWLGVYAVLVFGAVPLWMTFILWPLLGAMIALVSVNISHDAIHGAYTKKKWLKDLLTQTFNINGASAYMWKISHNHAHHNYTNIHGHDEDINPGDVMRIAPSAALLPAHKYQHIYGFFLYTLATLSWVLMKDYKQFFENKINNYENKKHPKSEYFYLFFYKFINYSMYIAVPIIVMPYSWGYIVAGYLMMHAVSGFYLAVIFMLAHCVEEVHFPLPDDKGIVNDDWVVHQMHTTANFSTESKLAGFLTGGLNQQIEHHLFANICSIHYLPLSKIVKETTAEYGVPYYDIPTFWQAIKSHYRFLVKMGSQVEYTPKEYQAKGESITLATA